MNPENIPFNALIVGPTNSGKTQFLVDKLSLQFRGKFDYVTSCVRLFHSTLPMKVSDGRTEISSS